MLKEIYDLKIKNELDERYIYCYEHDTGYLLELYISANMFITSDRNWVMRSNYKDALVSGFCSNHLHTINVFRCLNILKIINLYVLFFV
jgi:hypothetical protein